MPHLAQTDFVDLAATASIFSSHAAPETVAHDLDGIPRLSRTLGQVSHTSAEVLRARADGTIGENAVHAEALRLLAGRGFAAERLRRAVADISARQPFVARSARHRALAGDPAQLLALQRSAVAARAADDARLGANSIFRRRFNAAVDSDLRDARATLVDALRARTDPRRGASDSPDAVMKTPRVPGSPPLTTMAAGRTPYPRATPHTRATPRSGGFAPMPGTPHSPRTPGGGYAHLLPSADGDYLTAIQALLVEGDAPSVASVFHETGLMKQEQPHLLESFAMLAAVANCVSAAGPPAPHIRAHAGRLVLEDQFAERTGVLPVKPRQASGSAVRAGVLEYVRVLTAEEKLAELGDRPHIVDGFALWAQVFYCFRVGNLDAACSVVQAALDAGNEDVENYLALLQRFMDSRIAAGPDGGFLVGSLTDVVEYNLLIEEYRNKVWQSGDAYYRACYVLLARLELGPTMSTPTEIHKSISDSFTVPSYPLQSSRERTMLPFPDTDYNTLFGSVEDYMWLRLFQCRTELERDVIKELSEFNYVELAQIQQELVACGPSHFDSTGTQPYLYAFVLVCCGLYWEAVEFLSSSGDEQVMGAAAHIAMILHLLQWMELGHDYGAVLWTYLSTFMQRQPEAAAAYLLTIRDKEPLMSWLTRLVLETNEFRALLGSSTDLSHQGEIENIVKKMPRAYAVLSREDVDELRCDTARRAAAQARDREDYLQAVEMYALAGDRPASLRMLLQGITAVIDSKAGPNRELALSRGRETYVRMQNASETGPLIRSLRMILSIASFFDDYHSRRFTHAWAILSSLGLLPLTSDTIVARRTDLLPSSHRYDHTVRECASLLLRAALDIAEQALLTGSAMPEPTPSSAFHRRGPHQTGLPSQSQIKALVTFSGLMGLAETEVNARLVRIELLMA